MEKQCTVLVNQTIAKVNRAGGTFRCRGFTDLFSTKISKHNNIYIPLVKLTFTTLAGFDYLLSVAQESTYAVDYHPFKSNSFALLYLALNSP